MFTLKLINMWNDLSMKDKAAFIKVGVKNGLYSIDNIKAVYNKFSEGGFLDKGDDEKYYAYYTFVMSKSDVVVVIS